ncbi:L-rhamnose mutarotase [Pseudoalteromonas ardens]|uniref:L-rhamnose mutarotase n=1 Tax=Pseudoalteromonas rubra TaxID=43658 RepID=A0A0L0EQG3_9GAMM|nr:L-rhamnose mutarotase [Pseudoalteromonas sp. R96]KNC66649.1 hypothetical protein AC626_15660 [Pseudoalteromonas rubra]MDK1313546.1 L-rhamnose mutarotase [Pseudoalteromonas sp. R96]
MKSYGFSINFKDDASREHYEALHRDVWPEVKDAFEKMGIKSMQLFHMPPLKLFMYIEADERLVIERDFKQYVNIGPKVKEWDELCGGLLQRLENNQGVTDWLPMEKIYAYDRRDHRVEF